MAENEVVESSVQQKGNGNYWGNTIWRLASTYDIIPNWWSPKRDAFFRNYWYQENFLASAVYAIAERNAAFGWNLTGIEEDVEYAQNMLQFAEFGAGWQQFITKFTQDYLCQDNGAFIEIIRPAKVKIDGKTLPAIKEYNENNIAEWYARIGNKKIALKDKNYNIFDSPLDLPIGIANLDSGQCQRTGDPETPVIYTDRHGKMHAMKWWQCLTFNEMPSPIEKMNGVGYSALTRVFRASHIMQSIALYNDEKVSGRFNRAIFLTNANADTINDAIYQTTQDANNRGLNRYSQPIVVDTVKPDIAPSVATINLAEIPDNFNFNDLQNWYIANLALAFGVDYGFLAPLPGKGLGTASQSETAARQAKGKSSRLFMDAVSNALNFKGVLPKSVQFNFIEKDLEAEEQEEKQRKTRADRFKIYIEQGMVTPTIARQMASDYDDIPQVYVDAMGEEDLTPVVTVDGDTDLSTQQSIEDDVAKIEDEEKQWECETCKRCNHRNNIGFIVDDDVWVAVSEDYTVLCPTCFDELAEQKGIHYEFKELFAVTHCNCNNDCQSYSSEISENAKELTQKFLHNLPYDKIKTRRQKLFKKTTLLEHIKNVARQAFWKKQVTVPETEDETLNIALTEYADELDILVSQANDGQISQSEFESALSELVLLSLTALYSEMSGLEPDEFTPQDESNLDEYIAVNLDSVAKLSNDIYDGRYEPTEDDPDRFAMLLGRMGLWVANAAGLAMLGLLNNPEKQDNKLLWSLGAAEHCPTCLALDGQIHTVSEWQSSGFYPKNTSLLLCNGFNCACNFSNVPKNTPSTGSFSAVPTK